MNLPVNQKVAWFSYLRRQRQSVLALGLMAAFLAANLVINLALELARQPNTLEYFKKFLTFTALSDSWQPMRDALALVHSTPVASLYSELWFNQAIKFQYPPTSLLFLEPLRLFPAANLTSDRVLNGVSWLVLLALALVNGLIFTRAARLYLPETALASRWERIARFILPAALTLTFYPVLRGYNLGQIQTWIDFFFALLVLAWLADRRAAAGILCGLVCLIKPQLGLLFIWAALRKERRFVLGFLITVLTLGALSVAVYGLQNHLDYLSLLAYISRHGEVYLANQSVNGLLNRALFNGSSLQFDPHSFAAYNPWVYLGTLVTSVLVILPALFWQIKSNPPSRLTGLLIATLSFTLASPVAWEHHYGILPTFFAAALPLTLAVWPGHLRWLAGLGLAYLLSASVYAFTNSLAQSPLNFLQSYLFFGALVLLVVLYQVGAPQNHPLSPLSP